MKHRSGLVAIIGKPNVGKSTILNHLSGYKVSIVTEKPETTRNRISAVLTRKDAQIIFVDTPGLIERPKNLLSRNMARTIKETLSDVDLIVYVVDVVKKITRADEVTFRILKEIDTPCFAVINKADAKKKGVILPIIERLDTEKLFKEIFPASALKGDNMQELLAAIVAYLPEGEPLYPEDHLTDKSERFMVAEKIREQVLFLTHQEVPHAVAVMIDEFKERADKPIIDLHATIFVERHSQKKIIIGKKGAKLKEIGSAARKEIEEFLEKKIFLQLWVKVYENWRKDPQALKMLEYL
jgi:GTP-binding protein Era